MSAVDMKMTVESRHENYVTYVVRVDLVYREVMYGQGGPGGGELTAQKDATKILETNKIKTIVEKRDVHHLRNPLSRFCCLSRRKVMYSPETFHVCLVQEPTHRPSICQVMTSERSRLRLTDVGSWS